MALFCIFIRYWFFKLAANYVNSTNTGLYRNTCKLRIQVFYFDLQAVVEVCTYDLSRCCTYNCKLILTEHVPYKQIWCCYFVDFLFFYEGVFYLAFQVVTRFYCMVSFYNVCICCRKYSDFDIFYLKFSIEYIILADYRLVYHKKVWMTITSCTIFCLYPCIPPASLLYHVDDAGSTSFTTKSLYVRFIKRFWNMVISCLWCGPYC